MKRIESWLKMTGIFCVAGLIIGLVLCLDIFSIGVADFIKIFSKYLVIICFIAAAYFFYGPPRKKWEEEKRKKMASEDLLWNLKEKILKEFGSGPMDFSALAVSVHYSCEEVKKALEEMEKNGVVEKREPLLDDPMFQMWGINISLGESERKEERD